MKHVFLTVTELNALVLCVLNCSSVNVELHHSLKYVCKLCCEKHILYNTHINININGLEKAVYSTQANKNKKCACSDISLKWHYAASYTFSGTFKVKYPVRDAKSGSSFIQNSGTWIWQHLFIYFSIGCYTFRSSSEMKCSVSDTKRLIAFETEVTPTINRTDSVNKSKYGIKTHFVK